MKPTASQQEERPALHGLWSREGGEQAASLPAWHVCLSRHLSEEPAGCVQLSLKSGCVGPSVFLTLPETGKSIFLQKSPLLPSLKDMLHTVRPPGAKSSQEAPRVCAVLASCSLMGQ